jgi:hypothetical protein
MNYRSVFLAKPFWEGKNRPQIVWLPVIWMKRSPTVDISISWIHLFSDLVTSSLYKFLALPRSFQSRNQSPQSSVEACWGSGKHRRLHSRTQSPSYARCDEGLWPNPYSELASDWLVLTPDIVFLPCFCGIRLWIWPEPLVAPRVIRALGTRMRRLLHENQYTWIQYSAPHL